MFNTLMVCKKSSYSVILKPHNSSYMSHSLHCIYQWKHTVAVHTVDIA